MPDAIRITRLYLFACAGRSNIKILVAYPLLYTSIILNDKYRAQHAVDFGDMLERFVYSHTVFYTLITCQW